MDLLCMRCGEPWDRLSLEDEFNPVEKRQFLAGVCCPACKGVQDAEEFADRGDRTAFAREAQAAIIDALGDDLDGAAAMMEDFGLV